MSRFVQFVNYFNCWLEYSSINQFSLFSIIGQFWQHMQTCPIDNLV